MDKYLKWKRLIGLPVEIRQAGHTIATGTVDDAMPDSSILWLAPSGPQHRTMYERALKYEAWVDLDILPKNEPARRAKTPTVCTSNDDDVAEDTDSLKASDPAPPATVLGRLRSIS